MSCPEGRCNRRSCGSLFERRRKSTGILGSGGVSSYLRTAFLLLSLFVTKSISGGTGGGEPDFIEPIKNVTVPAGREVKLACSVTNLGNHKVAWIHFEGSAILTVQTHVITRNNRIKVTHDKHRTWYLHIEDVQESDAGRYMCQINTETAKTQFGYVHVVVPPNIDDSTSSSDVIVRESSNVSLVCRATGSPAPTVKWMREDKQELKINKSVSVREQEGEGLEIARISRLDMGAYLCIASNGVPPTVSKRIRVSVDFPPQVYVAQQLISVPYGETKTVECITESHPPPLIYWTREDGQMIHNNRKYKTENITGNPFYKIHMKLTIFNLGENDYGVYKCVSKNSRGDSDGTIKLQAPKTPPTTTTTTTTSTTTPYVAPSRKSRTKERHSYPREPNEIGSGDSRDQTQLSNAKRSEQQSNSVDVWPSGSAASSGGSTREKWLLTASGLFINALLFLTLSSSCRL